jgi:cyclohexa-1,5-dienecarbonyl-CoA hydratase
MPAVRFAARDSVARVTLARPPLNILDLATLAELRERLVSLAPRRDIKVIVFGSAIDGTFSAGVDVADHVRERVPEMLDAVHDLIRLMDGLPQVTIAAVDGRCLGGACEIVTYCDFVLATARATFAQPEIDVGCFPPAAAALLPRLVGRKAWEMILLGETLTADQAEAAGLVTRVVASVDAPVELLATRLAARSGAVLALAKKALRVSALEALDDCERIYREELAATQDVEEGVRAFLEKRAPRWSDQ